MTKIEPLLELVICRQEKLQPFKNSIFLQDKNMTIK